MKIEGLSDPIGGLALRHSGFVDLPKMLTALRGYFIKKGIFQETTFDYRQSSGKTIIFCEGPDVVNNPYWANLPFRPVRGEIIDIQCDLPTNQVYNRGVFMLPKENIFRVGSTYDHQVLSYEPQQSGIQQLKSRLEKLYSGSYQILKASAGVRPATHDRRPFIGWHPENKAVGIFNGFGTKGVSLVPYFSKLFVDSIERKTSIHSEADVSRVF